MTLETKRLRIRLLSEDDAPFILQHLNQPSFIENIRDSGVRTLDDARRYLREGALASYAKFGFGLYLVEVKESGEPIGMCGLLQRPDLAHPDIGFALDPPFWGVGYGLEAAEAVLDHAFTELAATEILAITSLGNQRSARLLEKLGMEDRGLVERDGEQVRLYGVRASPRVSGATG
ncbi:MAG: GNAT family N-acetyltransferase [Rhodothermales bacterium]|nr:GNAT family N-acetyltransferase [Rhodothermales bacterium]